MRSYYDEDNNNLRVECYDKFGNWTSIKVGDAIRCKCTDKDSEFIYVDLLDYTKSQDGELLWGRIPVYEITYDATIIHPDLSINKDDEFEAVS